MKRTILILALLVCAAAYVFLQTTTATPPKLATFMPSGAMLYLEAPDFGRLLRDWNASQLKADWLGSANYAVFSRSNLFTKLQGVYSEYGEAAGFLPDLPHLIQIAGTNSALALYGIRDVEFLYISRVSQSDLMKSELWRVREKFEHRQAAGTDFYLRTDPASKRTVAFAFAKDHLILATRDDLVARALELLAGGSNPSIASERWYHDSVAAAQPNPSELRLVMNLESITRSVYFRSYWIQRNVSQVQAYSAGLADIARSDGNVVENRIFLHASNAPSNSSDVASLLALVPPQAGLYKAEQVSDPFAAAALVAQKLIGTQPQHTRDWREAPAAIPEDQRAGSETDLETRIDEQPLPQDSGMSDAIQAIRAIVAKAGVETVLLLQSSSPLAGTFIEMPSAIVLASAEDWDSASVRTALSDAAGKLWTTSQLGAAWTTATVGQHSVEQLNGLGTLQFAIRGRLLFVSNNPVLLTAVLDRATSAPPATVALTYAAGFRHAQERANYARVMTSLDFGSSRNPNAPLFLSRNITVDGGARNFGGLPAPPPFFSGDIASLSRALSPVTQLDLTEQERDGVTVQKVSYQLSR